MNLVNRRFNLVLGGGGIKGIAYLGVFKEAERRGYWWGNIAGVSAGALAGTYACAGYKYHMLREIMDRFDFSQIKPENIEKMVPAVASFTEFYKCHRTLGEQSIWAFLNHQYGDGRRSIVEQNAPVPGDRGKLLGNIVSFAKEGYLYDGDYLEEWVYKVLSMAGIRTFGDLRGGIVDKVNPRGYKMRMTAVDVSRAKVLVLPDDIAYYGMDPDRFEVSRAIRMSTSVPFAFKPVEVNTNENGVIRTYHIIDGGVLDNFPMWLSEDSESVPLIGVRLDKGEKKKFFSVDTSLNILKTLISFVHDIGVPKYEYNPDRVIRIDTAKVSFMDFGLNDEEKEYLYKSGQQSAMDFFNGFEKQMGISQRRLFWYYHPMFNRGRMY